MMDYDRRVFTLLKLSTDVNGRKVFNSLQKMIIIRGVRKGGVYFGTL